MNSKMILAVFLILGLYIILCYYIGTKGKKIILNKRVKFKRRLHWAIYWLIYWIIALAFILSNMIKGLLSIDNGFLSILALVGYIYIGAFIYLAMIFLVVDILRFILKKIKLRDSTREILKKVYLNGVSVFIIVFIIVGFGIWNAQNKVVTNYEVNIEKKAGEIKSLNVVMISDVHMGIGIKENGVDKMVDSINELNPDIVLFCGDIFDENTSTTLKEYSREVFKKIKSKYGVYDITGNHEYGAGDLSETISYFKDGNVKFLQDEQIEVADSFYVVGRNDPASKRITGEGMKPLAEILKDVDKSFPIIVLNHRPEQLDEAEVENVDLQLSGHTHKGQIFPGNLVTGYLNEKDYGYLKKDNFNLIVSSGYGTWGPPIRIGSNSEIVNIKINFKQ
ncbi:putative metallophosphoesterase [Clostridium puniceum]|uniref:Putative metallophosphoesterase n=1 Tax=Clostridium puniceum TaxID=29367 RepID=A0A1S8TL83_9CLOT|nr:metallophosphoesterase [Clostridium puniceum]OOM78520.1 putative metallophosphoesterase [Clostridium puniceum]